MRESGPSTSAQTVAMSRAVLTAMSVIDDSLAERMLHRPQRVLAETFRLPVLKGLARSPTFSFLAARTRFFDEVVTAALDDGIRQVVIVGAGYDSRTWRLGRPEVRFFEVDHPATQRDKRRRAPPSDGPTYVPLDLVSDRLETGLPSAGFDPSTPAVFVLEGLIMYLPEHTVRVILTDLAGLSPPGGRLAVNFTVQGGGSVAPHFPRTGLEHASNVEGAWRTDLRMGRPGRAA